MAQKKMETAPAPDEKVIPVAEEPIAAGSFVNTFWDQFEQSRERALKLRENREDAYINALREVIKFNKQYRKSIGKLYEQAKKTNMNMVAELMPQFNGGKEDLQEEGVPVNDREELKQQLKEVSRQLEKLALTPIRSIFHIVDLLEDNFERNAESSAAYARERRNAWFQVRKEYVKLARNTHLNLVSRGRNSFKELVKTQ
ncbi:hypothetical protein [Neobacillus vireti]|uniref:Uncharacterized protein n=1 Tax=Neobacillus vireti LMG 21834 TaxID=1131730 RepID=A0AB94IFZ3_9BACI|nr:hypothetical protein [Neobacillus vireti]ETI66031.1 hypothetical protein BAVI_24728 [Neobacillus vireti LMG 21834]KLT19315.1 hypothetical protein AA980_01570 [Neobacillus vireti]